MTSFRKSSFLVLQSFGDFMRSFFPGHRGWILSSWCLMEGARAISWTLDGLNMTHAWLWSYHEKPLCLIGLGSFPVLVSASWALMMLLRPLPPLPHHWSCPVWSKSLILCHLFGWWIEDFYALRGHLHVAVLLLSCFLPLIYADNQCNHSITCTIFDLLRSSHVDKGI